MSGHKSYDYLKKILPIEYALRYLSDLRSKGKKIVFTNGCFDIIHVGHVRYLYEARKLGDFLIVGLNSDDSVRRIKGDLRPINDERSRAEILSALSFVDMVIIFEEDTPINLINVVEPEVLVKGGDWKVEEIVGAKEVLRRGGKVMTIKYLEGYSTTSIIKKLMRTAE